MIKTPTEIACLRRAVEIQNGAFRIFASRISRRMTESDLTFEMVRAQGEAGATDIGFVLSITHPAWAFFRAQSTERQMKPGELHWFDAGATYKGYSCDYDILLAWGEPTTEEVAVYNLVHRVYEEALESWRPGRPVAEIAQDTVAVMRRHGLRDPLEGAFLGHSLGFEVVERRWFSARVTSGLRLEPGMVIAPEWFASTSQGVFPWEENFLQLMRESWQPKTRWRGADLNRRDPSFRTCFRALTRISFVRGRILSIIFIGVWEPCQRHPELRHGASNWSF